MSLEGRIALVTAATGGIGFHVARGLAERRAQVIVTGRDTKRGQQAVDEIAAGAGRARVHLILSDASSVAENVWLAENVERRFGRLDILVNNAGIMRSARTANAEGLEATLATNFVCPFALTMRLLPLLRESRGRIVTVSSSAYRMFRADPFVEHAGDRFVGIDAYARSKLLGLLFTIALAAREGSSDVVANAVNPGMAWTPGTASLTPDAIPKFRLVWPLVRFFQRRASAERASRGPLWLATEAPDAVRGRYFDGTREEKLEPPILDRDAQRRAWALGEGLVARALAHSSTTETPFTPHERST
jgi:NAD(P)-dependent dehydrogenase (short-subunit alcohol dehydrogenase family)